MKTKELDPERVDARAAVMVKAIKTMEYVREQRAAWGGAAGHCPFTIAYSTLNESLLCSFMSRSDKTGLSH